MNNKFKKLALSLFKPMNPIDIKNGNSVDQFNFKDLINLLILHKKKIYIFLLLKKILLITLGFFYSTRLVLF